MIVSMFIVAFPSPWHVLRIAKMTISSTLARALLVLNVTE